MFFLSLSPLILNIAHPDMRLRVIFGENCWFSQNKKERAYLLQPQHIETCKPEYVKDCGTWADNFPELRQPNSGVNRGQIAILK